MRIWKSLPLLKSHYHHYHFAYTRPLCLLPTSHNHYHSSPTFTRSLSTMLPLIALEEHYSSLKVLESSKAIGALYNNFPPHLLHKLNSLGDERIQDLDEGKVSLQVISHGPGEAAPSVCTAANDDLAAAISKNPTRLAGFAMITMSQPAAAARELTRCVQELGFVGALVENHVDGQFYDDERFWPVFETADVPIYIHPCFPAENMVDYYKGVKRKALKIG